MYLSQNLVRVFGSLIQTIVSPVAERFEFSENSNDWIFVTGQNQVPRDEVKTAIYFGISNKPWKSMMANTFSYNERMDQQINQMRQIELTIDAYSKRQPMGTAQDIINYIHATLTGDTLENWHNDLPEEYRAFSHEGTDEPLPLTALLSGGWNERIRLVTRFNFRDRIVPDTTIYFTKVPNSIGDVPSIVPVSINLINTN